MKLHVGVEAGFLNELFVAVFEGAVQSFGLDNLGHGNFVIWTHLRVLRFLRAVSVEAIVIRETGREDGG